MHKFNARVLCSIRRALFFSLITAPALSLFFIFLIFSFNNSLAGTFVKEARELVSDVPADKVRICIHPKQSEYAAPVKPSYVSPCKPVLTDRNAWQENLDRLIRNLYLAAAFLGFSVWFLVNVFPHLSFKSMTGRTKSDR